MKEMTMKVQKSVQWAHKQIKAEMICETGKF